MSSYDTSIGTLLVGILFNTFLYGVVMYQFAVYHWMRFNDPPAVKYMVLFLFILDTFHSTSVMYLAWNFVNYSVTEDHDLMAVAVAEWPHTLTPLATALAALVTQMYLGIVIWRLTHNKILYGVVVLLAIPSFVLGMTTSIVASVIKALSQLSRFRPIVISWLSTQVVVDAFITITLVVVFSRSRTGLHKTDTILNRFICGAIQTGLFAGLFSSATLVTFTVLPNMTLYGMFSIPLGRIYTNTLMAILLTRKLLIRRTNGMENITQSVAFDTAFPTPIDSQAIPAVWSTTTISTENQSEHV